LKYYRPREERQVRITSKRRLLEIARLQLKIVKVLEITWIELEVYIHIYYSAAAVVA
jgi:hypothetical protein